MSNKKTLKQIKDDYAIKQGFANWYELLTYCNERYLDHYTTGVMILAQKQALQNASEKAPEMLEMLKSFVNDFDSGLIEDFSIPRNRFEQLIEEATEL